jgi:hypothetical protein
VESRQHRKECTINLKIHLLPPWHRFKQTFHTKNGTTDDMEKYGVNFILEENLFLVPGLNI